MAYRMKMFKSQKPSSVDLRDLRVSDFKRVPGFNYVSAEDEHTDNSLWIEGRVGDVFVNTPKMFQSVMSVWCARPSDLGSDMWLAVVEIPSKQQNAPLFGTLERAKRNSSGEQFGVASLASRAITPGGEAREATTNWSVREFGSVRGRVRANSYGKRYGEMGKREQVPRARGTELEYVWMVDTPFECLAVSSLSGRPALPLSAERALLVVGTPSSGTTQMTKALRELGLQVAHENSDSIGTVCRDGTVSWIHGALRFSEIGDGSERASLVGALCARPRPNSLGPWRIDGGAWGNGLSCAVRGTPWGPCWQAECERVLRREIGCARGGGGGSPRCTSPFRATLLQVRHPLHTIASMLAAYCHGQDTAAAADASLMLDTAALLFPPPAAPRSREAARGNETACRRPPGRRASLRACGGRRRRRHAKATAEAEEAAAGECSRRIGWFWVQYNARMLSLRPPPRVYRVEATSACDVLRLAGDEARTRRGGGGHGQTHGTVNVRNGRGGSRRLEVTLDSLRRADAALAAEVASLAGRFGYNLSLFTHVAHRER
ncbi:hypothetical protein EMIHUDRAFT_249220 [Emiliania huxleyi CCMP1516]|uniref:Uncharacterized protein n=2 Tax=Emiliania huxleyi TaxID=2903 RepID=A0A0D3I9Z1_EMIH1|nr:hypothetical protein EMIHUDRAFT_249220 [Emiliania huxleyi CCMP1516]EOD08076.1 hypothetical protein EMIHUDRAFT_249220 [Emiliania huxleyi CCMP1516]|eukprot:XP_005760505.1 hypothetical protein EMIHUDRAFT_249220 [Emiliania huxleyi CCMP1516]